MGGGTGRPRGGGPGDRPELARRPPAGEAGVRLPHGLLAGGGCEDCRLRLRLPPGRLPAQRLERHGLHHRLPGVRPPGWPRGSLRPLPPPITSHRTGPVAVPCSALALGVSSLPPRAWTGAHAPRAQGGRVLTGRCRAAAAASDGAAQARGVDSLTVLGAEVRGQAVGGFGVSEASPRVLTGSVLRAPAPCLPVGPEFLFRGHQSGWMGPGLTASLTLIAFLKARLQAVTF